MKRKIRLNGYILKRGKLEKRPHRRSVSEKIRQHKSKRTKVVRKLAQGIQ